MDAVTLSPNRVYVTAVCNKIVNDTDTLGKISKIVLSILDIGAYVIEGASKTFKEIGVIFKDFNDLTGGIGIIDRVVELFDPNKRAEFKDWEKACNKISLIVGQFFAFVSFVDKVTYKSLSRAALCVGGLPIIDLVKNIGFAVNSITTIHAELKKFGTQKDDVAKKTAMLKIAAEVSKLFMITIGTLLGIFAGYASAQFLLGVTVLGFASNAIGLTENLWKNVFSKKAEDLIKDQDIFPEGAQIG